MFNRTAQELRNPTLISLGIHILFALILLTIKIAPHLEIPIPEVVEISFDVPVARDEAQPARPTTPVDKGPAEEVVTLPERRMLEEEPPLLAVSQQSKISPRAERHIPSPEGEKVHLPFPRNVEKKPIGPGDLGLEEKDLPDSEGEVGKEAIPPFEFTWSLGRERKLISCRPPPVPHWLQEEATVVIQFEVLPDGTVGRRTPVIKGEALENLFMEEMTRWQFNRLPDDSLRTDIGIVKFVYKLR